MMKKSISAFLAAALLGSAAFVIQNTDTAFAQSTTGELRGIIKDSSNGEPVIGATVVATSAALQGEQVVITDEGGGYFLSSLPIGTYTLTVYYNDSQTVQSNVLIQLGKSVVVNIKVSSTSGKGEVITIKGTSPIVDQSSKTGNTITSEYTNNIPVPRTFGGVLGAAAGAQSDAFGTSFSGATSAENTFIVEGVNTTDTAFGTLSSNLPNEFIQETEVITGGYNAEYGRATGAVVNVITKSGSDEFKGTIYGYLRPGSLVSAGKPIIRNGSSISAVTDLDYNADLGGEIGGPIIKEKLWFHVGYNPTFQKSTVSRIISQRQDEDGNNKADIDPETGFQIRKEVARTKIASPATTQYFTAKLSAAINKNNQLSISGSGSPINTTRVLGVTRNPEAARIKQKGGAYDLAVKYTGKAAEGKTQVDAVFGYHHGFTRQEADTPTGNLNQIRFDYARPLADFAMIEGGVTPGCDNSANPQFDKCPVVQYQTQGIGILTQADNDRISGIVSLTQRVKLAGQHVFKIGADVESVIYNNSNAYTGGSRFVQDRTKLWKQREYLQVTRNVDTVTPLMAGEVGCLNDAEGNPNAACIQAKTLGADTKTRNLGAYIQDSWQVLPTLTLNAGVRYERQDAFVADKLQGKKSPEGEIIPKTFLGITSFAPRVGVIFDPTSEGKAKIFAHWGRFYESIPLDINVRAFGGEITRDTNINQNLRKPADMAYDANCDVTPGTPDIATKLAACNDKKLLKALGGGTEFVSPGLKGQYTQELVLGGEFEIIPSFKMGVNYIHRTLPQVIEDVSTDGGINYLITNPGANLDAEAAKIQAQADKLMMDPNTKKLGELFAGRAKQMLYVKKFDLPVRTYDGVQITATQRPTKASLIIASYTYSRSKGNYGGLFSTETNQLDPNLTSLYDLPALMSNRYGALGLDRPHALKVDAFYKFDLKKLGLLTIGGSTRLQSGIPHNTLASHPTYGPGESFLLPRGVAYRSPTTGDIDLKVSYGYQLTKTIALEGFLDGNNLLNSQAELDVDENYTNDSSNPIVGGDSKDLLHAKVLDGNAIQTGNTAVLNKNFNKLNSRQSARQFQLGFRLTF
jgi:outer membrane receptor protein involved in Fe transport